MNSASSSPNQEQSELGSPTQFELVTAGKKALGRQASGAGWADGVAIMRALDVGRSRSMHEAKCNSARGYKYCQAMARWLRLHGFDVIDKGERARFLKCFDHLAEIAIWREGLPAEQQFKLNYPPTVLKAWRADLKKLADEQDSSDAADEQDSGDDDEDDDDGELQQLDLTTYSDSTVTKALDAYTLERFLQVMPREWGLKLQQRADGQAAARVNARLAQRHPKKRRPVLAVANTAGSPTKH